MVEKRLSISRHIPIGFPWVAPRPVDAEAALTRVYLRGTWFWLYVRGDVMCS